MVSMWLISALNELNTGAMNDGLPEWLITVARRIPHWKEAKRSNREEDDLSKKIDATNQNAWREWQCKVFAEGTPAALAEKLKVWEFLNALLQLISSLKVEKFIEKQERKEKQQKTATATVSADDREEEELPYEKFAAYWCNFVDSGAGTSETGKDSKVRHEDIPKIAHDMHLALEKAVKESQLASVGADYQEMLFLELLPLVLPADSEAWTDKDTDHHDKLKGPPPHPWQKWSKDVRPHLDSILGADLSGSDVEKRWAAMCMSDANERKRGIDGDEATPPKSAPKKRKKTGKGEDGDQTAAIVALGDARRRQAVKTLKDKIVDLKACKPKSTMDFILIAVLSPVAGASGTNADRDLLQRSIASIIFRFLFAGASAIGMGDDADESCDGFGKLFTICVDVGNSIASDKLAVKNVTGADVASLLMSSVKDNEGARSDATIAAADTRTGFDALSDSQIADYVDELVEYATEELGDEMTPLAFHTAVATTMKSITKHIRETSPITIQEILKVSGQVVETPYLSHHFVKEVRAQATSGTSRLTEPAVAKLRPILSDASIVNQVYCLKPAMIAHILSTVAVQLKKLSRGSELTLPKWFKWKRDEELLGWELLKSMSAADNLSLEATAALWTNVLNAPSIAEAKNACDTFNPTAIAAAHGGLPPPTPAAAKTGDVDDDGFITIEKIFGFITSPINPHEAGRKSAERLSKTLRTEITEPWLNLVKTNLRALLLKLFLARRSDFWQYIRPELDPKTQRPVIQLIKAIDSSFSLPLVGCIADERLTGAIGPILEMGPATWYLQYTNKGMIGDPVLSPGHIVKQTLTPKDVEGNMILEYEELQVFVLPNADIVQTRPLLPVAALKGSEVTDPVEVDSSEHDVGEEGKDGDETEDVEDEYEVGEGGAGTGGEGEGGQVGEVNEDKEGKEGRKDKHDKTSTAAKKAKVTGTSGGKAKHGKTYKQKCKGRAGKAGVQDGKGKTKAKAAKAGKGGKEGRTGKQEGKEGKGDKQDKAGAAKAKAATTAASGASPITYGVSPPKDDLSMLSPTTSDDVLAARTSKSPLNAAVQPHTPRTPGQPPRTPVASWLPHTPRTSGQPVVSAPKPEVHCLEVTLKLPKMSPTEKLLKNDPKPSQARPVKLTIARTEKERLDKQEKGSTQVLPTTTDAVEKLSGTKITKKVTPKVIQSTGNALLAHLMK